MIRLCPIDGGPLWPLMLSARGVDRLVEPIRIVPEQRGYQCDRCGRVFTSEEVELYRAAKALERLPEQVQ
jgi:hypothetical protein